MRIQSTNESRVFSSPGTSMSFVPGNPSVQSRFIKAMPSLSSCAGGKAGNCAGFAGVSERFAKAALELKMFVSAKVVVKVRTIATSL
jgi:hypothetical protein